jgi:hypothetical protein
MFYNAQTAECVSSVTANPTWPRHWMNGRTGRPAYQPVGLRYRRACVPHLKLQLRRTGRTSHPRQEGDHGSPAIRVKLQYVNNPHSGLPRGSLRYDTLFSIVIVPSNAAQKHHDNLVRETLA